MSNVDVAIIDYGLGNLLSVCRGLEHYGAAVAVTSDPEVIFSAPRVILPGVGAFADGMKELRQRKLDIVVKEVAARGISLMGICLGMQMLMTESEEFGTNAGLSLIPGKVSSIPIKTSEGTYQKIPHIGWNSLVLPSCRSTWNDTILADLNEGDAVYFVHSFMAVPDREQDRIGDCIYGGIRIPAVIGHENVVGCQFHPEKSGKIGLKILQRFLST